MQNRIGENQIKCTKNTVSIFVLSENVRKIVLDEIDSLHVGSHEAAGAFRNYYRPKSTLYDFKLGRICSEKCSFEQSFGNITLIWEKLRKNVFGLWIFSFTSTFSRIL